MLKTIHLQTAVVKINLHIYCSMIICCFCWSTWSELYNVLLKIHIKIYVDFWIRLPGKHILKWHVYLSFIYYFFLYLLLIKFIWSPIWHKVILDSMQQSINLTVNLYKCLYLLFLRRLIYAHCNIDYNAYSIIKPICLFLKIILMACPFLF